jgi:hypothetical protein
MTEWIQWYSLALTRGDLKQVAEGMLQLQYVRGASEGYVLASVRANCVQGRYVERFSWNEEVEDPVAGMIPVPRVEVRITQFVLESATPGLELVNPPRNVKGLFNSISGMLGSPIGVAPVPLDLHVFLNSLRESTSYVSMNFLLTRHHSARRGYTERSELTGENLQENMPDAMHKRDWLRAKFVVEEGRSEGSIEVSQSGRLATIGGAHISELARACALVAFNLRVSDRGDEA